MKPLLDNTTTDLSYESYVISNSMKPAGGIFNQEISLTMQATWLRYPQAEAFLSKQTLKKETCQCNLQLSAEFHSGACTLLQLPPASPPE